MVTQFNQPDLFELVDLNMVERLTVTLSWLKESKEAKQLTEKFLKKIAESTEPIRTPILITILKAIERMGVNDPGIVAPLAGKLINRRYS